MHKVIFVSDSFKGTLGSAEICAIARETVPRFFPDCTVVSLPVGDGGEGTLECFLESTGGERISVPVHGPWMEEITADYARHGDTAMIEMAQAAGLPMVGNRKDPGRTTTYGVGELIAHAVRAGATNLILGLGGSCTNDAGCGCAAALGVRFLDADGWDFIPTGDTLSRIASIDAAPAREFLAGCTISAMCDIGNPMHGPKGAAHVFAPQKGADEEMCAMLDEQLRALDGCIRSQLGLSVGELPGAGAAGAMGAGVVAFLGGALRPGIEIVLDTIGFDGHLAGCDAVFTGEGRIDDQTLSGKVVAGVARRAARAGVPVYVLAGGIADAADAAYDVGVTAMFSTNRAGLPVSALAGRAADDYRRTLEDVLRLLRAARA